MTKIWASSLVAILVMGSASIITNQQLNTKVQQEETTSTSLSSLSLSLITTTTTTTRPSSKQLQVDTPRVEQTISRQTQDKMPIHTVEQIRTNHVNTKEYATNNLTDLKPTTTTTTTIIMETQQAQLTNQERSQLQMPAGNKLERSSDEEEKMNQDSKRETTTTTHPIPPAAIPMDVIRAVRSTGHQQLATIQSLAGQQLSIPCSNLSTVVGPANQHRQQPPTGAAQPHRASFSALSRATTSDSNNNKRGATGATGGISLIVWHKDDQLNEPIFVADARGVHSLADTKQTTLADQLRGRTRLDLTTTTTTAATTGALPGLLIDEATMQEAGTYTCTVEFHKAPTQTFQVHVNLVEPPKNMVIRDANQEATTTAAAAATTTTTIGSPDDRFAGAHDEDSRLELICEVEPGQPAAGFVSWWQLESVMQMPSPLAPTQQQQQQQQQVRSRPPALVNPFALVDKVNYISTMSLVDGALIEEATLLPWTTNLLVGAHSTAPNEQVHVASNYPNHSSGHSRRLVKHWRRFANNKNTTNQLDSSNKLQAALEINQLGRVHSNSEFMCLANNNNFSSPLNRTIKLQVNLKPTEVRIANKANLSFRLDQKTIVECQVSGSKPSALVRWLRGGEQVPVAANKQQQQQQSSSSSAINHPIDDYHEAKAAQVTQTIPTTTGSSSFISELSRDTNNQTKISYLTIIPKLSDNQQTLTCLGSNPRMGSSSFSLSDTITMNVEFAPKLELQFGTNIRPDSIKLAADIFMDCNVEANPPIDDNDLSWLLNGTPLVGNLSAGILMSNRSLVLQRVRVESRGSYQCLARNSIGSSSSNKLELRPKFGPICDYSSMKSRYEIPLNQATRIECSVLAEPGEDLYFTWRFNQTMTATAGAAAGAESNDYLATLDSTQTTTSGNNYDLDAMLRQHETNFTRSSVIFTPKFRRHYGQLLCSASNSMGKQEKACIIQVVPSELPEPVVSCFVDNQTETSFSVHCQPPVGGGHSASAGAAQGASKPVQYLLEVFSTSTWTPNEPANAPAQLAASTHLQKSRQPADVEEAGSSATDQDQDEDEQRDEEQPAPSDDNLTSGRQNSEKRSQNRIKRLLSDSPTFNVVDLRPNSSYNVQIYVQNSKGKSSPFHQQANTRPILSNNDDHDDRQLASTTTGRVELINRRPSSGLSRDDGLSDRLMSYLKLDKYFGDSAAAMKLNQNNKSTKPIVAIGLVVLLMAITLVMVVFFINRLCRTSSGSQRTSAERKRRSTCSSSSLSSSALPNNNNNTTNNTTNNDSLNELASNNSRLSSARTPLTSTRMTTSGASLQVKGSGSDTSRETNTDSTLISSPNQRVVTNNNNNNNNDHQYHQQMATRFGTTNSYCGARRYSERNSISGSLTRVAAVPGAAAGAGTLMMLDHRKLMSDGLAIPTSYSYHHHHHQEQQQQQQDDHHRQQSLSIQSGSDCTSTQPDGQLSEQPIYVMNSAGHFWSPSDELDSAMSGGNNNNNNRCQLFDGVDPALGQVASMDGQYNESAVHASQQYLNAVQLPNSVSIPVSLSDRLHVLARATPQSDILLPATATAATSTTLQRYSSQDYLRQQANNRGSSYLTLAPSSNEQYCYHNQQQPLPVLAPLVAPPNDFVNDYRRFKETLGIGPAMMAANQTSNHHHHHQRTHQESCCGSGTPDGSSTATTTTTTTNTTFDEHNNRQVQKQQLPHKHRVKFHDTSN